MSQTPRCWCGNTSLAIFSPAYLKCPTCETLITARVIDPNIARVIDDEQDFYGRDYWFSHQEKDLSYANIITRSRDDLPERCLHWLRTMLKYKLPPAKVLELGSAHGGFVAMLQWTGFDAAGLELSPWVVDFARRTFDVPVLLGPVEDQLIEPGSLDAIALTDVLEHLPEPARTIQHCLNLLKPDGILLVQTPALPENKGYEQMQAEDDPFLALLKEKEHLYLFSRRSISEFFHRLRADHLIFEPAIFAHYDMFFVASRVPILEHSPDEVAQALSASASGRLIQALLDLDDQFRELKERHAASEADRAARLEIIHRQNEQISVIEADRATRLDQIHELTRLLHVSEADRAARLEVIHALEQRLREVEAERDQTIQKLLTVLQSPIYKILARLGVLKKYRARIFSK